MKLQKLLLTLAFLPCLNADESIINAAHTINHVEEFKLDPEQVKLREQGEIAMSSFTVEPQSQFSNRQYRIRQNSGRIEIDALTDGQTTSTEFVYGTLTTAAFGKNLAAFSMSGGKCYVMSYQGRWISDFQYNCDRVSPKANEFEDDDDWFDEDRPSHWKNRNQIILLHASNKVYIYAAKQGGIFSDFQYGSLGNIATHRDLLAFSLSNKTYIYAVKENGFATDFQYGIERILPRTKQWDLQLNESLKNERSRQGYLILANSSKYYIYTYDRSKGNFASDFQYDAAQRVRQMGNTMYIQSSNKCRSYEYLNGNWKSDYAYKSCQDWVNNPLLIQKEKFDQLHQ